MPAPPDTFSHTVGPAEDEGWYPVLDQFQDASIFQTIAFGRARGGGTRLEQVIVRRGSEVVAAALVRLMPVPLTGTSIAYTLWGPLCHRRDGPYDHAAMAHALGVLRQEYVVKRGLALRIAPRLTREEGAEWLATLQGLGYRHVAAAKAKHTIVLDLDRPLDQLRRNLEQKWRNQLNGAERNHLEVREGDDDSLFELFLEVYREMLARKQLAEPGDIRGFMATHAALPDRFKLKVFVALEDGAPSAGVICSAIGSRGLFMFGATSASGMRNRASYLLQWRAVEWLKANRCTVYDLHGSDAEGNPGVYKFKMGLCGKNGREVEMLGHFEAGGGLRSRLVLQAAERANAAYKALKSAYERYRGFRG
jgi:lipid II:glycine glycyltransferase (peptidoglycan interpeptide bridge formation enzyme)